MATLAIFGAGPALGFSTAQRFAREGYAIHLVGRNKATLTKLTTQLEDSAPVDYTVADLADPAQVRTSARRIESLSGTPDVVLYSPGDVSRLPVDARSLDAGTLQTWLPLNLLSPIELAHTLIPGMIQRDSGALIVAQGAAVRNPQPALASSSVGQAGLLHFLHALSADVAGHSIRVASLQIGQIIERSAVANLFDDGHFSEIEPGQLPRINPDQLAQQIWTIVHDGEGVDYCS